MKKHERSLKTLKVARGQIESVIKMTEEDRYCIDISMQISATISLLKKAQSEIIMHHLRSCVQESIELGDATQKMDEIDMLLKKLV